MSYILVAVRERLMHYNCKNIYILLVPTWHYNIRAGDSFQVIRFDVVVCLAMAPYRCRIRDGCKDLVKVSMLSIHLGQFHIRYFSPTSERVDRPSGDMEGGYVGRDGQICVSRILP